MTQGSPFPFKQEVLDRFLRYVKYDTQSSEESESYPSTEKQKEFLKLLEEELKELGASDVEMDQYGYVMATVPANTSKESVPTVGFIAHVDTSPEVSGAGVKPIVWENYQGQDLVLPGDSSQVLRFSENPPLRDQIGNDIVTADGTTLLGADNKAGVAEIMTAVHFFLTHPEVKHGKIRVAFTPDEEVGNGTKYFDIEKFGAKFAYTIDGETRGEVENETFSADSLTVTFFGRNIHPGYAKGRMINSIKIAAEFIERLPKDKLSPETTEKREGYVHPYVLNGGVEQTSVKFLIRDFETDGLKEKEMFLQKLAEDVVGRYPGARVQVNIEESYRNMRYKLEEDPRVVEYALEAVRRAGLTPRLGSIRGGTDGSKLSYRGLLTPNIFAGEHNFHSKLEWVSIQDMEKAVEVIVKLAQLWEERSE